MGKGNIIDVIILCGGQGKRIQPAVSGRPKSMVEINGQPFLETLMGYFEHFGFTRFVLCTGYMSDYIKRHYRNIKLPLKIIFSEEKTPLGTAGAIKNAEKFIKNPLFLVTNGDSFCKVNLEKLVNFHLSKRALVSLAVTDANNNNDCGAVILDSFRRVVKFNEKTESYKNSFFNAGIYVFQKKALSLIPMGKIFSLENDFFPAIVTKGLYGYITHEKFIDIGTPERYKKAERFFKNNNTGLFNIN